MSKRHWWGAADGTNEMVVQVGHSIFLNNLQEAGEVSKFITNLIVGKPDRKVSEKAKNILPQERACLSSVLTAVMKN